MPFQPTAWRDFFFGRRAARRPRRVLLACDPLPLEGRVTPAHFGFHAPAFSEVHSPHGTDPGENTESGSMNSAVATARQALQNAVQTVEQHVQTTIADLTKIRSTFNPIRADTSITTTPSRSALATFENNLVVNTVNPNPSGATPPTALSDFEALYGSPTGQTQVNELTAAYNALVTAISHSNIAYTPDITSVTTAYNNLQTALGNTPTSSTFPYFNLVTGAGLEFRGGGGGCH